MKQLTFRRTSDAEPAEYEILEIDADGSFSMWRSTGLVVGRFAGAVPEFEALADDADRATRASARTLDRIPADASLERIDVDGHAAAVAAHLSLEGSWGVLVDRCRALMSDLCDQPQAALTVELDDPTVPRLVHRGTQQLRLELIQPAAIVTVWRDGEQVGDYWGYADLIETVDAGPDWRLDVPVPDAQARSGDYVVAQIQLDAYHDDVPRRLHVHAVSETTFSDEQGAPVRPPIDRQ